MIHPLIADARLVCVDTNSLIYLHDAIDPYFPFMNRLFASIEAGDRKAIVSVVTETELLVLPLRVGDRAKQDKIAATLAHTNLHVMSADREVAREAARIRAALNLKLPDAIIVATAVVARCDALVGNDRTCAQRVREIPYLYLDDIVRTGI